MAVTLAAAAPCLLRVPFVAERQRPDIVSPLPGTPGPRAPCQSQRHSLPLSLAGTSVA